MNRRENEERKEGNVGVGEGRKERGKGRDGRRKKEQQEEERRREQRNQKKKHFKKQSTQVSITMCKTRTV